MLREHKWPHDRLKILVPQKKNVDPGQTSKSLKTYESTRSLIAPTLLREQLVN
jgi:hypothetical protein